MKYGISNFPEETSSDTEETNEEMSMASKDGADTAATATMANTRHKSEMDADAVIFSIQFYGKTIGEVGMMNEDLSELDWEKFKSYLFQNLLSVNQQEKICVSYSDEEGDKLPIDSDEEYREALKVAKKKAEAHDKLVLDITRQGGFPAVFSLVSSGIKKVSSSPPKEGGISRSLFKAPLPPKYDNGFETMSSEKKFMTEGGLSKSLFKTPLPPPKYNMGFETNGSKEKFGKKARPSFFALSPPQKITPFPELFQSKGLLPGHAQGVSGYDCDEAFECGKVNTTSATTTTTTTTTSPVFRPSPVKALPGPPPDIFFNFKIRNPNISGTSACQDIFGAGFDKGTGARPKEGNAKAESPDQPPEWFTSYMSTFRAQITEEVSARVVTQVTDLLKCSNAPSAAEPQESHELQKIPCQPYSKKPDKDISNTSSELQKLPCQSSYKKTAKDVIPKSNGIEIEICLGKERNRNKNSDLKKDTKKDTKKKDCDKSSITFGTLSSDTSKCKKKEEKNVGAKRKKLAKEEERILKKKEKEERLLKKQEKLEKKKLLLQSKYADELDKANRTQEKVFAKMEGLRKKQFCSQEELSKLRKMVDKQQRFITTDGWQGRRSEKKAAYYRSGRAKKISIDNKAFPVDASLLHAALLELEALAEDSTSDGAGSAMTRGYDALYLKDITYPDGSVVQPGKEFVKTWRVVNNGILPWNEETTLCKWSQVRFQGSPSGWKLKPSMKRVVCPPLEPGQEGDISITFTAPSEPGWYATHWRFCQRGRVFGNQMWCAIRVETEPSSPQLSGIQLEKSACIDKPQTLSSYAKEEITRLARETREKMLERTPAIDRACREILLEISSRDGFEPSIGNNPRQEELVPTSDLGIVENYYDAEDPIQRDCIEGLQNFSLSCPDEPVKPAEEKKERDLILFEEEAEVVDSGLSTPEMLPSITQAHSVVPLKEIAKESVENLIFKDQEKSQQKQEEQVDINHCDSISMSSGSFSELDSEDQAILNESDSDGSDHDYYIVHLPDCFNTSSLTEGEEATSQSKDNPVGWQEEVDRPDSPDFLTADEDDRTTAVASDSSEDITCPVDEQESATAQSDSSQASSNISSQEDLRAQSQVMRSSSSGVSSLPDPPTETKPFMAIPSEAFQANVFYAPVQSNAEDNCGQMQPKQDSSTWAAKSPSVVCEQPYSSKQKETKPDIIRCDGAPSSATAESPSANNNHPTNGPSQLPVDLVSALPDELVSIIPEDLVRGAWNTARSFITRINQEKRIWRPWDNKNYTASVKTVTSKPSKQKQRLNTVTSKSSKQKQRLNTVTSKSSKQKQRLNTGKQDFIGFTDQEMLSPTSDSPGHVYNREEVESPSENQQPSQPMPGQDTKSQQEGGEGPKENPSESTVQREAPPPPLAPPLQQLEDMGFHNQEVNERLLTKYNGDVSCAVAELIILNCH